MNCDNCFRANALEPSKLLSQRLLAVESPPAPRDQWRPLEDAIRRKLAARGRGAVDGNAIHADACQRVEPPKLLSQRLLALESPPALRDQWRPPEDAIRRKLAPRGRGAAAGNAIRMDACQRAEARVRFLELRF